MARFVLNAAEAEIVEDDLPFTIRDTGTGNIYVRTNMTLNNKNYKGYLYRGQTVPEDWLSVEFDR